MLMPDLTQELIAWDRPGEDPVVGPATLDHVIEAIAGLHAMPWADYRPTTPDWGWPWCPLRERLMLLTRAAAEGYRADGLAVGDRFLAGWDAFDRRAPAEARSLIAGLSEDPAPLLTALGRLPATGIHGDLKLANVALLDDGRVGLIDWQMMTLGAGGGRARLDAGLELGVAAARAGGGDGPLPRDRRADRPVQPPPRGALR